MFSTLPQLDLYLQNLQIAALNDMQRAVFEAAQSHDHLTVLSNTGSGKTLAFLLPLIARMQAPMFETQALIIVPTRELAMQIEQVFRKIGTPYKITACYGGHKREIEENNLLQAPKIIVGTPGRLGDHFRRGNIHTHTITDLVIDEFDKCLEMGYTEDMSFLIQSLPNLKKKIMTSATQAIEVPAFVGHTDALTLNYIKEETAEWEKIIYQVTLSKDTEKAQDLFHLLCQIGARSTIVFCNHKEAVERLSEFLKEKKIQNVYYHGSMEQRDRDAALAKFKNGSVNVLVTTDLASRGLDIANIRFVIHYQIPHTADVFTHRNGRTARMDASGTIICMLTGDYEKKPAFIQDEWPLISVDESYDVPEKSKWVTMYLPHGKKNKVNKIDIVGFLLQDDTLVKEDIGLIEVKDFHSFVAIRRSKSSAALHYLSKARIKGKIAKLEVQK